MTEGGKGLLAAAAVVSVVAAGGAGVLVRQQVEMGTGEAPAATAIVDGSLMASNSDISGMSEGEYFYKLTQLLSSTYVEQIQEPQDLAAGAVRGLIGSLADPHSRFYDADEFKRLRERQAGTYHGIGAELQYRYNEEQLDKARNRDSSTDALLLIPDIVVAAVLPGSPAEEAGLEPGDVIESIEGKWVMNPRDILKLRRLNEQVEEGSVNDEELMKFREDFNEKAENSLTPARATQKLNEDGDRISLTWLRDGKKISGKAARRVTSIEALRKTDSGLSVTLLNGSADQLARAVKDGASTLDLRGNPSGSYEVMEQALKAIAPSGEYGVLRTDDGADQGVKRSEGSGSLSGLQILTDRTTQGAAAAFALALEELGAATVKGDLDREPIWVEQHALPNGSGYTLAVGKLVAKGEQQ